MSGPNIGQLLNAGGGISQEQQALADYNFGESEVGTAAQFAQTPDSTMKTQSSVGDMAKRAFDIGKMSHADFEAMSNFANQQIAGIGQLAGKAGGMLGGGGGG